MIMAAGVGGFVHYDQADCSEQSGTRHGNCIIHVHRG